MLVSPCQLMICSSNNNNNNVPMTVETCTITVIFQKLLGRFHTRAVSSFPGVVMQMDYLRNKTEKQDKKEEGFFPLLIYQNPSEDLINKTLISASAAAFSKLLKRNYERSTVMLFLGDITHKNSIEKPFCWLCSIRSVSISGNTMSLFSFLIKAVRDDLCAQPEAVNITSF